MTDCSFQEWWEERRSSPEPPKQLLLQRIPDLFSLDCPASELVDWFLTLKLSLLGV